MKKLKIKSSIVYFILSFFILHSAKAQDSSHIRISLLTCSPGDELYSTFGHSALRITDSIGLTDIVFNYGTFDFESDFYIKFIRGKLLYYVSADNFQDFKEIYQSSGRNITEQVLNFSPQEKIEVEDALFNNLKDENKYYKYDFFFDNCTTRLRDIIKKYKKPHPVFKPVMPAGTTFRQAIYQYLDKNDKYWSKLGIDLLLGARTDYIMTAEQSQFLPDNLMKSLDSTDVNHQLVLSKANLYPAEAQENEYSFFTPSFLFWSLLIIIVALSFVKNNVVQKFLQGFDGMFFFLTGLMGVIIILMWTATDHALCKDNYNLLWAWPTHIVMAFFLNSKKAFAKKYFLFTAILLIIVLLSWFFLPQLMNNALIPLVLLLIFRSYNSYQKKTL